MSVLTRAPQINFMPQEVALAKIVKLIVYLVLRIILVVIALQDIHGIQLTFGAIKIVLPINILIQLIILHSHDLMIFHNP